MFNNFMEYEFNLYSKENQLERLEGRLKEQGMDVELIKENQKIQKKGSEYGSHSEVKDIIEAIGADRQKMANNNGNGK